MEDKCYFGKRGQMRKELNNLNGLNALDESTLIQISGGAGGKAKAAAKSRAKNTCQPSRIACCSCGGTFPVDLSASVVNCKYCGYPNQLSG